MGLVNVIKNLCEKKGVTFAEVERSIGISNGQIRRWDNVSPKSENLQKIAEYFGVSADFLLYGFDKAEFTSLLNMVRYRRSIKEFALDTGLDEHYLNRLFSGVEYNRPSVDTVLKLATHNENDWLVDAASLFKAAGYDPDEISGDLLNGIPLELLHYYQGQGMSEIEMAISHAKFKEMIYEDAMTDPDREKYFIDKNITELHRGENLTPTEKEFLILARHVDKIPEAEREKLKTTITDTIDLYLSRINKKNQR